MLYRILGSHGMSPIILNIAVGANVFSLEGLPNGLRSRRSGPEWYWFPVVNTHLLGTLWSYSGSTSSCHFSEHSGRLGLTCKGPRPDLVMQGFRIMESIHPSYLSHFLR